MSKSGAAASSLPKCKFFDQMKFLLEKSSNIPTISNISSPDNATPSSEETPKRPPLKKIRQHENNTLDSAIMQHIETTNNVIAQSQKLMTDAASEDNEVDLYCKSLVPIIVSLPLRKKRLAMIKIRQLLFDIEFEES